MFTNNQLLKQFHKKQTLFSDFTQKLDRLLVDLLKNSNITFESIQSRPKAEDKFLAKARRPNKNYSDPIKQITDLTALRIIVPHLEDIKVISELIRKEFIIDRKNSINKGKLLNPNEFGYITLTYIISLRKSRTRHTEWKPFDGLKAEIQIRTILEHAWASISRELDYQHEDEIPRELRRELFRLSAILELSDIEFQRISEKHKKLEK